MLKKLRSSGKAKDILIVEYKDGRKFVVSAYEEIAGIFQVSLYGTKGSVSVSVEDSGFYYSEMLKEFTRMVETGKEPFPPEETLEIIRTLVTGEGSGTVR